MKRPYVCVPLLSASLILAVYPARADTEADAAFLARVTVNDRTLKSMRSLMMPIIEGALRTPQQGRLLTERGRREYLAIFDEQFDYLMRNDTLAVQKQVFLKLYTPDELAKIRTMFESEAWTIIQSRTDAHQEAVVAAAMTKLESVSKYIMARLETRARDESFEIWEAPGIMERLLNAVGSEKP